MNSTLSLNPITTENETSNNEVDYIAIAIDVVVPFLFDKLFFKGTKGRLIKLVGTVAAQQLIRILAKSKTVDDILDKIEGWLSPDEKKTAQPYPSLNDAMQQSPKKYRTKSKPEDYYDPEREMFY